MRVITYRVILFKDRKITLSYVIIIMGLSLLLMGVVQYALPHCVGVGGTITVFKLKCGMVRWLHHSQTHPMQLHGVEDQLKLCSINPKLVKLANLGGN
jgi:hypothetical protein